MKDGHLNKCKSCCISDRKKHIADPKVLARVQAYDRKRSKDPERKKKSVERIRTMRKSRPKMYKAHTKVNNAIRDGKLKKKPCKVCGETKVQAHHPDYRKPLLIVWLCKKHHVEIHKK